MISQPSPQTAPATTAPTKGVSSSQPLELTSTDIEIAMDAIAQLIPHLDLQDCLKVIELATAQASLAEVLDHRRAALQAIDDEAFAA